MIRKGRRGMAAQVFECGDGREAPAAYARIGPLGSDWTSGWLDGRHQRDRQIKAATRRRVVIVTNYDDADYAKRRARPARAGMS